MVRKVLANEPLKDITMERVRVKEFKESLCKILGMTQSCFSLGFLSQNSLCSLHFMGVKGIYTRVR